MKKKTILKSLLVLLPILAVGLATTVNSVTVFDAAAGTTEFYSYFSLVPVENVQLLPPLAAVLSLVSGILAAIYLGKKKEGCLKASGYAAFAAAAAAALPVALRGEILVVPNVALPIFMLMQYGVTYFVGKEEKEAAKKLSRKKKR